MNLHLWNFHKNLILKQNEKNGKITPKKYLYINFTLSVWTRKYEIKSPSQPHCLHPCPPLINYEKSKVSFCKIIKSTHEKKNANIQSDEQLLLKKKKEKTNEFLCNYFACMCSISTESWLLLCVYNKQHLL